MFSPFVDMHTHTVRSDGRLTPKQLIDSAYQAGIRVMSITDHNYTEDLTELRQYAATKFEDNMILIQGAEISAIYADSSGSEQELHIVALGFDPDDPDMKAMLVRHQPDRRPYIDAILKRLREDCGGIDIGTYDEIRAHFPATKFIGRMAIARLLTDKGYTSSVDEAFDLYIGSFGERRAYVKSPLQYSSLEEVVRTVIRAGGIPVLAHLLYYDLDPDNRTGGEEKERLVRYFKSLVDACGGVGGMEVYYTRYKSVEERLYLLQMARKYGLMPSAGSDYHAQETWETLEHRTSCSACADLLNSLGVSVTYAVQPAPLYVMSGFSGVGKGTVCGQLKEKTLNGKPIALIRSVTNRAPRHTGENYTFVTPEQFSELVAQNLLLEYNDSYAQNNGYGTPVKEVKAALQNQRAVLLEIDRVGLCHLLTDGKIDPSLVRSVFIAASAEDVAKRLYLRGTEDEPKICARLKTAMTESHYLDLYDAVIVNDVVEDTVEAVLRAFEGAPLKNTFDPAVFRSDMGCVLTTYWRRSDGLKYDPVEDTSEYRSAIAQIDRQLSAEFGADAPLQEVWQRKKALLKAVGIHWRTPGEMNPDHSNV